MGPKERTSTGRTRRWRMVLVGLTLALGGLVGTCGEAGDPGSEDAALPEAETPLPATDTASIPARTDVDEAGPAEGTTDSLFAADSLSATDSLAAGDSLSAADDSTAIPEPPPLRIPPGTRVRLATEADVSTDAYEVGDPVVATVIQEVVDRTGEILIPQGTYFLGRVEASAGSGGIGEPAILEVAFETLSAWNYERPIETVVVDVAVTLDEEADRARRSARGRDALRVVPGVIRAGTTIVVQLRDPVFVPPFDTLAVPVDSTLTDTTTVVEGTDAVRNRHRKGADQLRGPRSGAARLRCCG